MKPAFISTGILLVSLFIGSSVAPQEPAAAGQGAASTGAPAEVPRLIKFSGALLDARERPVVGPVGVTFALYQHQTGGAALWIETQNVKPDENGNYAVLLGANSANGVAAELFASGEARWLGVQVERDVEQPRVPLISVPYALKAGDAQTLGGLPPSAFARAGNGVAESSNAGSPSSLQLPVPTPAAASFNALSDPNVTTLGGTVNFVPKFDTVSDVKASQIFDNGTGVGIGFPVSPTPTPLAKLDINGSANIRGTLRLPATGTASSTTKGFNSQPLDYFTSVFNGTAAVSQHFRWQAEPVNQGLSTASGKLNLLFASGTGTPGETGLSINSKGQITFASGQTFPTVTGNEKITGNVSANQLQSSVATGTAPLVVKSTTQVANLNASFLGGMPAGSFATRGANVFSSFQSIAGNGLSMYIGDVACPAGTVGIQAQVFSFGCSNFAMMLDTSGNMLVNRPSGGTISFREGNGSDQVTIRPGGRMGIGNSSPSAQLDVQSTSGDGISSVGRFVGRGVSARGGTNPGGSGGDGIHTDGGAAGDPNRTAGNGITALGGDVPSGGSGSGGFGIDAVGGLNSNGTRARAGEFTGDVEVTGCLSVSPGTTAHVQFGSCLSDVRLKKNIEAFPTVLDKVVQLQPVTYNWRIEEYPQFRFSSGKDIGLIAQEVEKVFPNMVSTDEAGYKRVSYGELPYLMLQAIRELKAESDNLKAENDKLRERIQRLEAVTTPTP
jgi:hypothetical protein